MRMKLNKHFLKKVNETNEIHYKGENSMLLTSVMQRGKRFYKTIQRCLPYLYFAVVLLLICRGQVFADDGGDYFKNVLTAVVKTFGDGSGFEKLLYIAEAVATAVGWLMTKSPKVLIGLPVLMIITHWLFGMVPAS